MNISNFNQGILSACLTLLFVSSTCHAEIYKWVDANGQTHYSERKEDAGKAKAVELKVRSEPKSTQSTDSPSQYWQEQETQFRQRQATQNGKPKAPPADTKPKPLSDGTSDETHASRCNLAKDVISGAVRHSNGKPTDKYDREIAENDIRTYCR
jgi:hypothetical protein